MWIKTFNPHNNKSTPINQCMLFLSLSTDEETEADLKEPAQDYSAVRWGWGGVPSRWSGSRGALTWYTALFLSQATLKSLDGIL